MSTVRAGQNNACASDEKWANCKTGTGELPWRCDLTLRKKHWGRKKQTCAPPNAWLCIIMIITKEKNTGSDCLSLDRQLFQMRLVFRKSPGEFLWVSIASFTFWGHYKFAQNFFFFFFFTEEMWQRKVFPKKNSFWCISCRLIDA